MIIPQYVLDAFNKHQKPDSPHNKKPRIKFFLQDGIWKPVTKKWYQDKNHPTQVWSMSLKQYIPNPNPPPLNYPIEIRDNMNFWDILEFQQVYHVSGGIRLIMKSKRFDSYLDLSGYKDMVSMIKLGRAGFIVGSFFFDRQLDHKNTSIGIDELIDLNR